MHCQIVSIADDAVIVYVPQLNEKISFSDRLIRPKSQVSAWIEGASERYSVSGRFNVLTSDERTNIVHSEKDPLDFEGVLSVHEGGTRSLILRSDTSYIAVHMHESWIKPQQDVNESDVDEVLEELSEALGDMVGPASDQSTEALADRYARMEQTGEFYVDNVEISFPPQVKAETGWDGVVVDIRHILRWMAEDPEFGSFGAKDEFLHIADKYYPEDEDYDDTDDDLDEVA